MPDIITLGMQTERQVQVQHLPPVICPRRHRLQLLLDDPLNIEMVVLCLFIVIARRYISIAKARRPGAPTRSPAIGDGAETRVVFDPLVLAKKISK